MAFVEKIQEHFILSIISLVFIGGLTYAVTGTYRNADDVKDLKDKLILDAEENSKKIDEINKNLENIKELIASDRLIKGSLTEEDLNKLITEEDKNIASNEGAQTVNHDNQQRDLALYPQGAVCPDCPDTLKWNISKYDTQGLDRIDARFNGVSKQIDEINRNIERLEILMKKQQEKINLLTLP